MLLNLQSSVDVDGAWADLWQELHHQGDVGVASYAAVPHLVRIHRERGVVDWNTYALVATIELARDARSNPPMPTWLAEGYDHAIQEMAEIGYRDLRTACGSGLVRSILGILAIAKGARSHGRILSLFSEDEVLELEKHFYGEPE